MAPTLAELESELSRDPKSRRFYELAREYQKQGRMDEAMALCERGLGNYPSQWQARILLAQLYIGKARLEEARTMVERVLLPLPDNVPANHLAADIYRALGDSERALKHYRIVDLLDPGRAGVEERIAELSAAGETPSAQGAGSSLAPPAVPAEEAHAPAPPAAGISPESPPAEEAATAASMAPADMTELPPRSEEPTQALLLAAEPPRSSDALPPEGAQPTGAERAEEDWLADTAAFDRELLDQEDAGGGAGLLAGEVKSEEETGPLELSAVPDEEEGLSPVVSEVQVPAEEGLNTATLAELYEHQGFPEKAVEIYQRVLLRDPDNRAVRDKIQALLRRMAGEVPEGPAVHQEDVEKALRRKRVVLLQEWLRCVREGSHV